MKEKTQEFYIKSQNVITIQVFSFYNCRGLTSVISNIPGDKLFALSSRVFSSVGGMLFLKLAAFCNKYP